MFFQDRVDAGRRLADRLVHYADRDDVIVLGLPRGGVPVALEVARRLNAPLDVFVVRKLGLPGYEELAMGAIASGGVRVVNEDVLFSVPRAASALAEVTEREAAELERREHCFREGRPPLDLRERTVIVVDDGLATGATMRAAVAALRQHDAAGIVVAVPVGAASTCEKLREEADELVCLDAPDDFRAVGEFYSDFSQTTDDEVREALAQTVATAR